MPRPDSMYIDCLSCGQKGKATIGSRGPIPKQCDRCKKPSRSEPRSPECEVCNKTLPIVAGRGRPAKACSDACKRQLRKIRDASPERVLVRFDHAVKRARAAAGQPLVMDCAMCGDPVDSAVRGPHGDLEEGFAVHTARGSDPSGEFFNCADRYEEMRKAQRAQKNRRIRQ